MKKTLSLLLVLMLLAASAAALADDNWVCGNCGATNGPSRTECWQCGVPASQGGAGNVPEKIVSVSVGDYITFGAYPQNSSNKTPIEWLVLDIQDNEALLISRYALDSQPYNTNYANVTWETCSLRAWLNGAFYNTAFTAEDKKAIVTNWTDNSTSQGPTGCAAGGNDTEDNVFLLSHAEAMLYFLNDSSRRCLPTAYARSQGAWTSQGKMGLLNGQECVLCWWLRSPGWNPRGANLVYTDGETDLCHSDVSYKGGSVRPAIRVDLRKIG